MAAQIRFSHLFILVSDLARAKRFYVEDLGFDVQLETPGYLRVGAADGFYLGIEEGDPGDVGASGIEVVIEVDDVDRAYERLSSRGIRFDAPPRDQDWGARHAWLRDPDGYRLSIYSRVER